MVFFVSVYTPLQKRKVKGRAKHRKTGLRGRSMGSRKLGKMGSVVGSSALVSGQASPLPGTQVAPVRKPRGRPPKERSQPFAEFIDAFQAHQKTTEGHTQGEAQVTSF